MGKAYLAMYFQVKFDLTEPPLFIPIMHFAENSTIMATDIEQKRFFQSELDAGRKAEKVLAQSDFRISVLLFSLTKENVAILNRGRKQALMSILEELNNIVNPTTPVTQPARLSDVSLHIGTKDSKTPYPETFVGGRNFATGKEFRFQIHHARFRLETLFINPTVHTIITLAQPDRVFAMHI